MPKARDIDPIPEEFSSYEEAAEFWGSHDTMDYPEDFIDVEDSESAAPQDSPDPDARLELNDAFRQELMRSIESVRRGCDTIPVEEVETQLGLSGHTTPRYSSREREKRL